MLEENQYRDIERYINNEMNTMESNKFEQALKSNPILAQTLATYRDTSILLEDVQGSLDFNQKLAATTQSYRQANATTPKKSFLQQWWWSLLLIGLISMAVWWQFGNTSIEEQEEIPLPSDIPIAALWENTEMPSSINLRNTTAISTAEQILKNAFKAFEADDYTATFSSIDSIALDEVIYPKAQLLKGVSQFELDDVDSAITTYQAYLSSEENPRDMALWYLALAQLQNEAYIDAKVTLNEIITEDYQKAEAAKDILNIID